MSRQILGLWNCVHFVPPGESLLACSQDLGLCIWNLRTRQTHKFTLSGTPADQVDYERLVCSPGGHLIAVPACEDDAGRADQRGKPIRLWSVRLWDTGTGRLVRTINATVPWSIGNSFQVLAFSSDGAWLTCASVDGIVLTWHIDPHS